MKSKSLLGLGIFVVAAILAVIACEPAKEGPPVGIQPVTWQDLPVRIPADGVSQVELTVTVLTVENDRVQNATVTFRSRDAADTSRTLGYLSQSTVVTDENGEATTYLTSIESHVDTTALVYATIDTTGSSIVSPRAGAGGAVGPVPPGSVAIVSAGPLSDEELEARLHNILLDRARDRAVERQKGMGALLGDPQGGQGAGELGTEADELTVIMEGVIITLSTNKSQLPADGVSQATIEARVRTTRGINVQDADLNFAALYGKITPGATTDQFGSARVTLTSAITDSLQDLVTAVMGISLTDTLYQDYVQPVLTISSDEASLPADGRSTTSVRARLLTPTGNPVAGAEVAFGIIDTTISPDDASLTIQGTTNTSGEAIATLKAGNSSGPVFITAGFSSLADTVQVQLLGLSVSLTPDKTSILANGQSSTKITLVAKTQGTNVAVVGKEVTFATDLGTIPATATTNESGIAAVNLKSATSAGTATITAVIGSVTVTTQVQFTATANISVELNSLDERLLRDGQDETTVTASVVDGEGNALTGRVVTFSLTGNGTLSTTQPQQTGSGGLASVKLLADANTADGNAQIIATSEGQSDTLDIPLRGITMTLTASPTSIVANGTNKSSLSLLVKETTTNAGVGGRSIQFASTLGTVPAAATTNASGVATVDLTSGTASGTATVTATLGTLSVNTTVDLIAEAMSLNLTATKGWILRDGEATVTLSVLAQDPNGILLDNRDVSWAVSGGSSATVFPTVGQTGKSGNPSGTHTTELTADANSADATATVTATVGDSTKSIDIDLRGVSLSSFVQPDTILANGTETAVFTWQATQTTSGQIVGNHSIIISKASGPSVLLSNISTETNSSGIATVTVKSTTNAGDLVMEAEMGTITQQQSLHLLQDQFSVSLVSDKATLLRDGEEYATLTATVLDKMGDPVNDQRVDFTLTGDGTLAKSFAKTNSSGEASVEFTTDVGTTNSSAQIDASVSTASDAVTIPLYGVTISVATDPDSLVADRDTQVTVEATVKEAGSSTPLTSRQVYFAVGPGTYGTITASATTDSRGIATATLTGDTTDTFAGKVYARLGSDPSTALVDSINISVVAPVRNLSLESAADGILRNREDTTTLTAMVTNNNGDPIEGQSVAWSLIGATPAGASLSVSSSPTDDAGEATVILKGDASSTDATATVQAKVGSTTATYDVTLQGVTISITALPATITANGVDEASVEATLKETTANRGVSGETITFSTTLGTIGGTATTDANGKATVKLVAGTAAGTATVQAYNGPVTAGINASTTVSIVTPVATSLSMTASPENVQVKGTGGTESSTITATVLDKNNQAVPPGVQVEFELSPSNAGTFKGTATKDTVVTDGSGQASVEFQSGTVATPVTITASVLGTTVQSKNALITVSSGPVAHLDIAVTPISWNDDGLYERELHIVVTDTFSNAVADQLILWRGEPDSLENSVVPVGEESRTDNTGVAHSLLIYNRGMEPIEFTLYAEAENGVVQSRTLGDGYVLGTATAYTLLRDGLDITSLSATVNDFFGTKVGLVGIDWSNPSGTGTLAGAASITDENGDPTASVLYQSDASNADTTVTLQASYMSTLTDDIDIDLVGVSLAVSVSPDTLSANGTATSVVSARFFETTSQRNLSGYEVEFASSSGSITGSAITGSNGVASVTYTAPTSTGTDTIIASRGGIADTTYVELIASSSAAIALVADPTELAVLGTGGTEISAVTATVWDASGQLVAAGTSVTLTASAGTFANGLSNYTKLTDANGQVTFAYQSPATPGTITFTATSGAATGSAALINVVYGPATQILVAHGNTPTTGDDGFDTLDVAAVVSDATGDAVAEGTVIQWDLTAGQTFGAITPITTTDDKGATTATLTFLASATGNTITIRARLGSVSATVDFIIP